MTATHNTFSLEAPTLGTNNGCDSPLYNDDVRVDFTSCASCGPAVPPYAPVSQTESAGNSTSTNGSETFVANTAGDAFTGDTSESNSTNNKSDVGCFTGGVPGALVMLRVDRADGGGGGGAAGDMGEGNNSSGDGEFRPYVLMRRSDFVNNWAPSRPLVNPRRNNGLVEEENEALPDSENISAGYSNPSRHHNSNNATAFFPDTNGSTATFSYSLQQVSTANQCSVGSGGLTAPHFVMSVSAPVRTAC